MRPVTTEPRRCLLATFAVVLLMASGARAAAGDDLVELLDGDSLKGRVVYEDEDVVVLRVGSHDREIARAEVKSVRSATRSLNALLDRLAAISPVDATTLLPLADEAQAAGLDLEARLFGLGALAAAPGNEAAATALDCKRKGAGFALKQGGKWIPTTELDAPDRDWKDRWVLETRHYELHTNLGLTQAVHLAFDLEGIYRTFFELFAGELRLLDVDEPMRVEVHADAGSYPEPGGGRPGYFDPSALTLMVDASRVQPLRILAHEATHGLFYSTTQRTRGAQGQIPSWLDEGLAQYLEYSIMRAGWVAVPTDFLVPELYAIHASAKDPHELKRLLTMDSGDFMASKDAQLKYAQAYTLVHHLLHTGNGARRPIFFDFVRRAYAGQSSMSDFKKALGEQDLEDFDEAWLADVRAVAGRRQ